MNTPDPLQPQTLFDSPVLTFDFPAIHIGVAEYVEGPTGCTVFVFPDGAATEIDARGGMVGKTGDYNWNHAICFAGGSLPGLEAASGVSAAIYAQHHYDINHFALVSGAIIYDYGSRKNTIYPDFQLGKAALGAAKPGRFLLGARGAGRSARCGNISDFSQSEASGQGGAFRQIGPTKIAVFTVVNALGVVLDRHGQVVRGGLNRETGQRTYPVQEIEAKISRDEPVISPLGNTTLTLLVTNQKLERVTQQQLGRQVHTSMARAIQPFHTLHDGDIFYTVTTREIDNPDLGATALGIIASELAWDAILASKPS